MSLPSIALEIGSCTACPLHRGRKLAVPGEGNPASGIFLLGEAPGREEDIQGRPFVGRAGKFLDLALEEAGLSREDVFITSVVKCRPENNRKPKKGEVETCMPYTYRQIRVIKPRVIVPLGNVALEALTGKRGISRLRGKPIPGERVLLPTYHPAAVLRNRNLWDYLVEDLKKARDYSE